MPTCRSCRKEFPYRQIVNGRMRNFSARRYCLDCSPFGNHNTRRLHLPKHEQLCVGCGLPTENAKYCTNRCQKAFEWRQLKVHIERDGTTPPDPRAARRYLLDTTGRRCSTCGLTRWQGQPVPLVLHHVDGNADNWALGNLRLVCGNCDMLLPTYKSKNRGNGRAWRRVRYAAGHSY